MVNAVDALRAHEASKPDAAALAMEDHMTAKLAEAMGLELTDDEAASLEAPVTSESEEFAYAPVSFDFDEDFQLDLAAYACRDSSFVRRCEDLVSPDQFENYGVATVVDIALDHASKYGSAPSNKILFSLVKSRFAAGKIRDDLKDEVKTALSSILKVKLSDTEYMVDRVGQFSKHHAVEQAMMQAIEMKEKSDFAGIEKVMQRALQVGAMDDMREYDYFAKIKSRTEKRKEAAAGTAPPTGISTGIKGLDKQLYHKGWGRKEMVIFMGGPKAGKSTALGHFGMNACLQGYNVLYVSLEVSDSIIAERLDAAVTDISVNELESKIMEADKKVREIESRAGKFHLFQFPPDTFSPNDLRRLLDKQKAKGVTYDMLCIDYGDIMAPNFRTNDTIKDSKSIFLALRAIAMEQNAAMLTATQTNRDGAKSGTATMADVAEDFNKVRIADLLISINKTEEEKANQEARLYFAASRNQRGDLTVKIKQDLEKMKFLTDILDIY